MNKDNVLLKVRNVKKYFNTPSGVIKAIDDVSFDVRQGEIIGLIGESGSGKTTVGRCLIRLYEEYSGFVGLDGQAISGAKLNKRKKRFLNQNMQMIFQDPHASLNTQQNIYTILREPLIVNKIMEKEYDDLFKDWEDVKNNFKYTFAEELRKIELDTAIYHTKQAQLLLNDWIDAFRKIKFSYENIENDFNKYFAFKINSQEREGNVISRLFQNNSKALDLYFEYQNKFRNDEIELIEKQLKKKRDSYRTILKQSKMTEFEIRKNNLLIQKKEKYENYIKTKKQTIMNHSNIVNSYVREFKNSYLEHLEIARSKTNYDDYNKAIIHTLLSKKMYNILKSIKRKITFLSSEGIDVLVNDFKRYRDSFQNYITDHFKPTSSKKFEKELKHFIDATFVFDFNVYCAKSKKIENLLEERIKTLKKEIDLIQWTFPVDKRALKARTEEEVDDAKEEFEHLESMFKKIVDKYVLDFNERMNGYRSKMIEEHEKLEAIRDELEKVEIEFNKKHNEFISGLKSHLEAQGKSKKYIESQVNIYENKVKNKVESLEAFQKEVFNLKDDLEKIKHLLGVKESISSKKHIKKILMREKIFRALEEVGLLRQFAWRYPHEFSGGQRQRIVIARALISNPKVIIADEPIASLDVSIQAQVVNILKDLCRRKNVSLIFIAHDLSMVEYIADKILIMHLGKIVEFGKTEEIYSNPVHPYTINLFKSVPKISNANEKFESSNFELTYLEEQHKQDAYVDFFELNKNHIVYSTIDQFKEWTSKKPKISKYTKNPSTLEKLV